MDLVWTVAAPTVAGAPVVDDVPGRTRIGVDLAGAPATESATAGLRFDARAGPVAFVAQGRWGSRTGTFQHQDLVGSLAARGGGWVSDRVGFGGQARLSYGRRWTDAGVIADLDAVWTAEIVPSLVIGARHEGPAAWLGPALGLVRTQTIGLDTPEAWTLHPAVDVGAALWSDERPGTVTADVAVYARISGSLVLGVSGGLGW